LWLTLEEVRQSKTTAHCSEEGRIPDEWRFILGVFLFITLYAFR
jgi:hypothetical protein